MAGMIKDAISLLYYVTHRALNRRDEIALVYHSVGNKTPCNDPYRMNLKSALFEKQIELISSADKQNIIATFDDGFENFYDNAFPVISRYNIKAILFITTDFIDGKMSFDAFFGNKVKVKPLTWQQIKKMSDSGIEVGSHTLSHPNLAELDRESAYNEISVSKKKIEDMIGKKVEYFAYPFGSRRSFNDHVKQIVKDSGYERAYTNIMGFNGVNSDPYELKRIRIYSGDNIFRFKMKIKGAYNWTDSVDIFGVKK